MTASFVSPLPPLEGRRPASLHFPPNDADNDVKASEELLPSRLLQMPQTPDRQARFTPITPNPYPAMSSGEEQYANVEGVVIWEGAAEEGGERLVFKRDGNWEVVWRGLVPIG